MASSPADACVPLQTIFANAHVQALTCRPSRGAWIDHFGQAPGQAVLRDPTECASFLRAQGRTVHLLCNGGIYDANQRPVGLCVERGLVRVPLNRSAGQGNFYLQPNGVFFVDCGGARVLSSGVYAQVSPPAAGLRLAVQSGPLLLEQGTVSSALTPKSTNRTTRSGVGVKPSGDVLFALATDPINFYDFASFFLRAGCSDALYLDGAISSFWGPAFVPAPHPPPYGGILAVTTG